MVFVVLVITQPVLALKQTLNDDGFYYVCCSYNKYVLSEVVLLYNGFVDILRWYVEVMWINVDFINDLDS